MGHPLGVSVLVLRILRILAGTVEKQLVWQPSRRVLLLPAELVLELLKHLETVVVGNSFLGMLDRITNCLLLSDRVLRFRSHLGGHLIAFLLLERQQLAVCLLPLGFDLLASLAEDFQGLGRQGAVVEELVDAFGLVLNFVDLGLQPLLLFEGLSGSQVLEVLVLRILSKLGFLNRLIVLNLSQVVSLKSSLSELQSLAQRLSTLLVREDRLANLRGLPGNEVALGLSVGLLVVTLVQLTSVPVEPLILSLVTLLVLRLW
jgi:hypothetical protein